MTPLSLHLEYFGPYRDTTVDFTKFSRTPLFLISGKTGSGKTTIFDGMCYALFNQTSGGDREPQAMRSDFATYADLTRVTFIFSHRDRRYEIVREPAQTIQKKRGDGVREVGASAVLTVWHNQTEEQQLTKINQVHDFLENLLQMDGKQFAQIVLLPQGQFRRFLVASSDEKAKVLQQLFNTELFASWANQLNQQLRAQQNANKTAIADLQRSLGELTWDAENQATATELQTAQKTADLLELMTTQQAATQRAQQAATARVQELQTQEQTLTRQDTQEEQLVQDQHQLVSIQTQQVALKSQVAEMVTLADQITELEWVQAFQPTWQAWQTAQQALTQRQQAVATTHKRLDQAQADLATAETAQGALADLRTQLAAWQKQQAQNDRVRPVYQQIAATQTQLAAAQDQVKTGQVTVRTAQTAVTENERAQEQQAKIIAQQATLYTTNQELTVQVTTLTDWHQRLADLQQRSNQVSLQQQQLDTNTQQAQAAEQQAAAAQQTADELYQTRLRHQIAELSAQLTPGSPCPVCGSTEHPAPASTVIAGTTVSAKSVQEAQTRAGHLQTVATNLRAQETQLKASVQRTTDEIREQLGTLRQLIQTKVTITEKATLTELQLAVGDGLEQTQTELHENASQLKAVQTAQQRQQQLMSAATQLKARLDQAQTDYRAAQTTQEKRQTQLVTQQTQLPAGAGTLAEFTAQEERLATQVTAAQQQITAADQQVTLTQQAQTVAHTDLQNAETEVQQQTKQVAQTLATVEQALADHGLNLTRDQNYLQTQLTAIATLPTERQRLQTYRTQVDRLATTQAELTKRIAGRPTPDRQRTQAALTDVRTAVAQAQDQRYACQNQWTHNAELVKTIHQQLSQQATAIQATQELGELAGVLNGDGPNTKLGLERYVLQTYLRQILTVGNQRLQQLTNGRYQFVIDNEPSAYKKNSGLEIDVYDDHVGEQRSVHTLSGGESFIAALALALALGEVIQRTTGSVDVDALFIDEGFGSLDEDALMTALDSLETVEGQHRMIGIISHVSELQAQVPNQLQVIAGGNGESHVTYQTLAEL